ncbi:integrase core domain protein [Rhizoctonia solani AG-3 Rhs1AP]|uniref:Integrase core domain protein n=2 Tax=Rhizoctonia solani AG-3 TaxID=1086053 RepID=A0A074RFL7_9AGAM|nr:integrase core domain protein [Rhizoctonia solani AG-3 Rhs1AP]KEP45916.1 integrase core domain protein [Rhizoctonia solani 123E]
MKCTDATGSIVLAIAKGDAMIPVFFDNTITWLKLDDVYYAPSSDREHSLISVSKLYAAGITVEWKNAVYDCSLLDRCHDVIARGSSRGCKWYLDVDLDLIRYNNPGIQDPPLLGSPATPEMVYPDSVSAQSLDSIGTLEDPAGEPAVACVDTSMDDSSSCCQDCEECSKDAVGPSPLSLVHSDLYGPLPVSVGGNRYAASFIDDYSRFARIYFLKSPAGYLTAVKSFVNRAEKDTQSDYKLQVLHTGSGEGAVAGQISAYLSTREIEHTNTYKQHSVAREFNETMFTRVQTMLFDAEMEQGWWEDAAAMAVYMFNRSPNPLLDFELPLDVWSCSKKRPTSFVYRAFGSRCTATVSETRGGKEFQKSMDCQVLRFDTSTQEWFVLAMAGDKIFGTKDVVFEDSDGEYESESE